LSLSSRMSPRAADPKSASSLTPVSSAEICQVGLIDLRVTQLERAAHVCFLYYARLLRAPHRKLVVDADPHVRLAPLLG